MQPVEQRTITVRIYLLEAYTDYRLGKLTRETMAKEELQAKLGKSMKITSTRLGELVKQGNVVKTEERNYKITSKVLGYQYYLIQSFRYFFPRTQSF